MSRPLPDLIEPQQLAVKGRVLRGVLALKKFIRLQDLLSKSDGDVKVDLAFGRDEAGQANIKGLITVALWMQCQRCMAPMLWSREIKVCLALVHSEPEAEKLPPHYEPLFLQDDSHSLIEIVENEIILALPHVALHSKNECSLDERYKHYTGTEGAGHNGVARDDEQTTQNPFAVLKQMKKKD